MPKPPPLVSRVLTDSKATEPTDRFVLAVIASHVGDNDRCWPSYETLAAETGYSVRTVKRSVERLQGKGSDPHRLAVAELVVERHGGLIAGRPKQYQPNAYFVVLSGDRGVTPRGVTGVMSRGVNDDTSRGDTNAASGDTERGSEVTPVAHELQEEPSIELPTSLSQLEHRRLRWANENPTAGGVPLLSEFRVGGRYGQAVEAAS